MENPNNLRKFKLIDREGFLLAGNANDIILRDHLKDGVITGYIDCRGNIGSGTNYYSSNTYVWKDELKFFEEIIGDIEKEVGEWVGEGKPPVGAICEAYHSEDKVYYEVEVLKSRHNGSFDVSACMDVNTHNVFWSADLRPIKETSWQEQLCEEFNMVYVEDEDSFVQLGIHNSEDMIKLAKRVVELSGE